MSDNGTIRDRIKSFRRVRVSELHAHPKNWRKHPDSQRSAMSAVLDEIGFADALLVRETDSGLQIIDGHLRADLAKDQEVPVLVLDVTEAEAEKILATHDVITGLAEDDTDLLRALTHDITFDENALTELLDELTAEQESAEPPNVTIPELWQVIVDCADERQQKAVYQRLTAEGAKCRLSTL